MSSLKSGYFWELQAWMADNGVSVRELALLTTIGKSVLNRTITGQFARVDPYLQRQLKEVTKGAVAEKEWAAFLQRRLDARAASAA